MTRFAVVLAIRTLLQINMPHYNFSVSICSNIRVNITRVSAFEVVSAAIYAIVVCRSYIRKVAQSTSRTLRMDARRRNHELATRLS